MGLNLFDDANDNVDEDFSKIQINKEFAKRFEHNKKREDLHRLEEMKKKGLVADSGSDSESETSDEDENIDAKKELQFLEALIKAKNQDPILKEKDANLFESEDSSDEEEEQEKKEKTKKPKKYLKDVMAEHLIEEGPEFEEEEDGVGVKKVKSYAEEQEEYRQEVLKALQEAEKEVDDGGDEFLKEKDRAGDEDDENNEQVEKKWDEYFGQDEKLDEKEIFLKEFLKKKMWIDKEEKHAQDEDIDYIEDEEEIEKQEEYERDFNFRYEEAVGDRVLGHSRQVDGSVRKKDNARKRQREHKEERMVQAEIERKEEVKRLKNLKKKEIEEKLNKIREVAGLDGVGDITLTEKDLEEDFDPDEFDKKMKAAFGEEYYDAEDVDPGFGSGDDDVDLEKPDFEKEDELLGLPKNWDVCKPGEGFLSERMKTISTEADEDGHEEGREGEGDVGEAYEGKRKRKRKMSLKEKIALEKDLEELYKLDYEDTIGDLKTRFKYKPVQPRKFGLTPEAVLLLDEKELNQYVSLKKLAPYRDEDWKVPHEKKRQMKKRYKEILGEILEKDDKKKMRRMDRGGASSFGHQEHEKVQEEDGKTQEDGGIVKSRRAKRRQRQSELKMSQSRLMAYGKISANSNKKSKS